VKTRQKSFSLKRIYIDKSQNKIYSNKKRKTQCAFRSDISIPLQIMASKRYLEIEKILHYSKALSMIYWDWKMRTRSKLLSLKMVNFCLIVLRIERLSLTSTVLLIKKGGLRVKEIKLLR